ncbi:MAG: XdhC family protein [Rhodobacteraceae bacterium]|nr:XdhC family protein [Paracoccaceae bacterium]MCY4250518.1 XdhC family protein [Paracoccaceae bacterium]MCY4308120.1 XdhC family protein [Paracoccaceae bacterium]
MNRPEHDKIPETALKWHQDGGSAIATVTQTWGSAPRPIGSQLAINLAGEIVGSVSGGCVEGAVVAEALDTMETRKPILLEFGVADEDAFAVGLACGGKIKVVVEPIAGPLGITEEILHELVTCRSENTPAIVKTSLDNWESTVIPYGSPYMTEELLNALELDRSGMIDDTFINVFNPPLKLIVVGGVHIAQPLIQIARHSGYQTMIIDPRESFGSKARFPGERISNEWPDEIIREISPDLRTAVVTLTHDPKIDDPAILEALKTPAFYIGCLGSTRTHAKRLARLREKAVVKDQLARIHGPIGLDIGSRSPAEIAIAIMAEITLTLRSGKSKNEI